jgi:hypothetical protein
MGKSCFIQTRTSRAPSAPTVRAARSPVFGGELEYSSSRPPRSRSHQHPTESPAKRDMQQFWTRIVTVTYSDVNGNSDSDSRPLQVVASNPVAFLSQPSIMNQPFPLMLNADGTVNSQTHPAAAGLLSPSSWTAWVSPLLRLSPGLVDKLAALK